MFYEFNAPFYLSIALMMLLVSAFMGWVVHHALISPHQRMILICTWNVMYLYLVSGSPVCIFLVSVILFDHGLCYCCHSPQPEYHLLCQMLLVNLWISHLFFIETCPVGAAPNSNLLCLYLLNWHVNIVRHNNLSSSLRLSYPEFASLRERDILHHLI